ncbi:MAG: GMC family oxidoreductase [Desulfobacteraceae bacterium]|nr:GMC family oxidoreductase [Desulfobacteraceae bacterium]MBC2758203.1 GMC family oxidoreductase [Desulfobacteraceae bacterium]
MGKNEYDVIIVGTGVGGASVGRDLSLAGRKVLFLEKGGHIKRVGNTVSAALMTTKFGFTRSREKNWIVSVCNYGGSSNLAAGCAAPPPKIVFDPVGIDLTNEAGEAQKELWINNLPDELTGRSNLRLMEAANDLGYNWEKFEKYIDIDKCEPNCSDCMNGCSRGAKWTARVYGDEAIQNNADIKLHARVDKLIIENGRIVGVEGKRMELRFKYYGKSVVLSAALGNAPILQRAGIKEAGMGFACDYLQFIGGISPHLSSIGANPMAVGTMEHYESDGIVILPVFYGWGTFALHLGFMGPKYLPKFFNFWKYTGVMVKIRDDIRGRIFPDGSFSKPISREDRLKLSKGVEIIKKILKKAGCNDNSMFVADPLGAHPSASCRIGEVVDTNLETRIKNLFCCDTSVFPSSLGLPTMWTTVSLGKRLAKHLDKIVLQ